MWLGRRDSNPRMPGPKPGALPLGDGPIRATRVSAATCNIVPHQGRDTKLANPPTPPYNQTMHKHYGFTIVEVLVVVLVLGILMTLGGLAWRAAREDAINNESKTELLTIQNAVEEYYSQNGEYPWPASCSKYSSATNRTCDAGELNPLLVPKYLKELPTDWRGKHYEYTVNKSPDNRYGLLMYRANGTKCRVGKGILAMWWNTPAPAAENCDF